MYFIPNGLSGAPCSVMDPQNGNLYRILPNGQTYKPFNGFMNRLVCDDINGGCYPEPFDIFDISINDTNFILAYRSYPGNIISTNCHDGLAHTYSSYTGGTTYDTIDFFTGKFVQGFDIGDANDSLIFISYLSDINIRKSTNRGLSFELTNGLFAQPNGLVRISPQHDWTVFVSTASGMYRTLDRNIFNPMGTPSFTSMAFDSSTHCYGASSSGLFKSDDRGLTWTQISSISGINVVEINPDNPSIIYIGTDNGVYRSINAGVTFNQQGYNFPTSNKIIGISKDPGSGDTIFVCTDKAVYKVYDLATGENEIATTIPVQYRLYQNYPNPFNPSTNISFDLPEKSDVSLIIYDGMGRTVTELVNATFISGQYTFSWDAGDLSSGVYFAKLQTKGVSGKVYTNSRKMLLIK